MAMEVKPSPVVRKLRTENGNTWFRLGALAELMGDQEKALFAYENSLRHSMYNVAVLRQAATICRARENYTKAVEYLRRILDLEGNDGEVWGSLGHCYLMMDNLQNAYTAYQQALYHLPNPKDPNLWYGIGILYDRYGSFEHAEEAFTAVLKMDPKFEKSNEIYFRLGIMYKQQLKHEESLNFFRYILNDPPHPLSAPDIWFQIGHVYELGNQFDSAREAYERVLAENPNHVKVLQQLGWLYHHNSNFGDQDTAIRFLLRSLDADPADGQTWYLLGRCFMAQQKYRKAYDAYQQAIYRDGRNPTFWCSIGVLYYQINQPRDALDAYSRAIRLNPYLSEVWYDLGTLYESCSQIDDALDAYQRAAQLDPKNTHIRERLDVLRSRQHSDGSQNQHLSSVPQPRHPAPVASSMAMHQHLQPGSSQNGNHAMIAGGGGGGGIPSLSNMIPPGGTLMNGGGLSTSKLDEKRSKKKHSKKKHSKKKKRRKRRHEEELAASKSNLSSGHESAVASASAAAASVAARLSGTSSLASSWLSSSSASHAATTGGESSSSSDNDDSSPPPSTTLHAISAAAQSHAASRSSGHPGSVPGLAALSGAAGVLSTVGVASAPSSASSSGSTAPSSASSLFTSQPTVTALGSSSVTGSRDPLLAHLSQGDKGPALPPLQMGDSEKSSAPLPSPKDQIVLTELATKRPRETSTLQDDSTSSPSSSASAAASSSSSSSSSSFSSHSRSSPSPSSSSSNLPETASGVDSSAERPSETAPQKKSYAAVAATSVPVQNSSSSSSSRRSSSKSSSSGSASSSSSSRKRRSSSRSSTSSSKPSSSSSSSSSLSSSSSSSSSATATATVSSSIKRAFSVWNLTSYDVQALGEEYVRYSYRPFGVGLDERLIDPRAYYFAREYLLEAERAGDYDLALLTTWLTNVSYSAQTFSQNVAMPFNVNNMDCSVLANSIFAIVSGVQANTVGFATAWEKAPFRALTNQSAAYVAWAIRSGRVAERPDLGLTYYPSIYAFYWFVSRTVHEFNGDASPQLLDSSMRSINRTLTAAMRDQGTAYLVNAAVCNGTFVYWDDFLGDNDTTADGKPLIRGQDRLFSTAVSMLALLNTWTQSSRWIAQTPGAVPPLLRGAALFLKSTILSDEYEPWNAFFSGSVHSMTGLPFNYPANHISYINGTILPLNATTDEVNPSLLAAMDGVIPEAIYQEMVNGPLGHFGLPVGTSFSGFNDIAFPFWCSPSITYATALLALTQAARLVI